MELMMRPHFELWEVENSGELFFGAEWSSDDPAMPLEVWVAVTPQATGTWHWYVNVEDRDRPDFFEDATGGLERWPRDAARRALTQALELIRKSSYSAHKIMKLRRSWGLVEA
jgi:hypothetical protein